MREGREEYNTEYKPEYERLKQEREKMDLVKTSQIKKEDGSGKGKEINMGLCHSIREEAEVPENIRDGIYLRHPGDEDEEPEEEVDLEQEEESREAESFKNFVHNRSALTEDKIKKQNKA